MSDQKNQSTFEINQVINQPYKYGFQTIIEKEEFPKGINENIVKLISHKKKEPSFLVNFRLKAYENWKKMKFPNIIQIWNSVIIKIRCFTSQHNPRQE